MGSNTYCQGLTELGFLMLTALFSCRALIISGTSLSLPQSPPPITLPARAVAISVLLVGLFSKNEFLYDETINSAAPLLAL